MKDIFEIVAEQLNSCKTKADFDSIVRYHFNGSISEQHKALLEKYGAKLDRFNVKPVEIKKPAVAAKPVVNVKNLTKMVIDEPIIEEKED